MDKIEYSSACELLDALQRRVISSRELLEYYFSRIEKYDVNSINSIAYVLNGLIIETGTSNDKKYESAI